jgi:hypothetical protein
VKTNEKKKNVNPVCRHVSNLFEIMTETLFSVKVYMARKGGSTDPRKIKTVKICTGSNGKYE